MRGLETSSGYSRGTLTVWPGDTPFVIADCLGAIEAGLLSDASLGVATPSLSFIDSIFSAMIDAGNACSWAAGAAIVDKCQ